MPTVIPTKASLRQLLAKVVTDDTGLERLIIDYFPDVAWRLSKGQSFEAMLNEVLRAVPPELLLDKLASEPDYAPRLERYRSLLIADQAVQPGPASDGDFATSSAAGRSHESLASAIKGPRLREQMARFRSDFAKNHERIAELNRYKAIHDALQALELPYNVLSRGRQLLATSPEAWEEHSEQLDSLLQRTKEAIAALNVPQLGAEFQECREWLLPAREALCIAQEGQKLDKLDQALRAVKRLLGKKLSPANTQLVNVAQALRLADMIDSLRALRGELSQVAPGHPVLGKLDGHVASLDSLNQQVSGLTGVHDQWQAIDNRTRLVADVIQSRSFSQDELRGELEDLWPSLLERLTTVLAAHADKELGKLLGKLLGEVQAAWERSDMVVFAQRFAKCLSKSSATFRSVDKSLLETCNQLKNVGEDIAIRLEDLELIVSSIDLRPR